ncbi:MAG TPA: isoprenylcysteine carboxylmethyltransferase family protein [Bryobacteraceae bacterium]|jgi:protein-S-isoprenylcysteine O-methyltransferase Ste14|nr:isoprenylcysteine carboxylmethyltransferase family protein [Bryobacteraceae bacterium]
MEILVWRIVLAALLLACFGSFTWGVRNFFVKPEKMALGMRVTLMSGTLFSVLHLLTILFWSTPETVPAAIAAGLYGLSCAMFWWAIRANRVKPLAACFAKSEAAHLVQHGPYRYVRHPFYCSYLLAWVAGAVGTMNIWLAFTAAVMFVLYLTAAVNEENKFAASPLADAYAAYRASTGRFFPKPF